MHTFFPPWYVSPPNPLNDLGRSLWPSFHLRPLFTSFHSMILKRKGPTLTFINLSSAQLPPPILVSFYNTFLLPSPNLFFSHQVPPHPRVNSIPPVIQALFFIAEDKGPASSLPLPGQWLLENRCQILLRIFFRNHTSSSPAVRLVFGPEFISILFSLNFILLNAFQVS